MTTSPTSARRLRGGRTGLAAASALEGWRVAASSRALRFEGRLSLGEELADPAGPSVGTPEGYFAILSWPGRARDVRRGWLDSSLMAVEPTQRARCLLLFGCRNGR